MECDKVKELLPFLDDDTLEADVSNEIQQHLEHCESCRCEYHEQGSVIRQFRAAYSRSEQDCSPEFIFAVQTKIKRRKETLVLYRLTFSAAAVVLFVIGISMYGFFSGTSSRPPLDEYSFEETTEDLENYVAAQYLTVDEISTLVDESYVEDDRDIFQTFISANYYDITPEDIIETLDDDDIEMVLASY